MNTLTRSRAVLRPVQPSTDYPEAECAACNERIIYRAKDKPNKVVANVYENGIWRRVETFHPSCYSGQHGDL